MQFDNINIYDYVESVIGIVTIGVGTYIAYRVNGGSSGRDFAERYFSIGFVVELRFLVYLTLILASMIIYFWIRQTEQPRVPEWFIFTVVITWMVAVFWRIIAHVKQTATMDSANQGADI